MRRDSRLTTITEALRTGPGGNRRATHRIWGRAAGAAMDQGADGNVWAAEIHDLALHIFTRLYGRPLDVDDRSALAQADEFRRRRDLGGEIDALVSAGDALESAPWYPARPGDLVHVHFEQAGDLPPFGETYLVGDAGDGLFSLQLLAHSLPETVPGMDAETTAAMAGGFAAETIDCPFYTPWFEAGPRCLTIIRDGRPVHVGGAR